MVNLGNRLPRSQKGRLTCKCKKNRCNEEQLKNGTLPPGTKVYFNGEYLAAAVESGETVPDYEDWIKPLTIVAFNPDPPGDGDMPGEGEVVVAITGLPASFQAKIAGDALNHFPTVAVDVLLAPPNLMSCRSITLSEFEAATGGD